MNKEELIDRLNALAQLSEQSPCQMEEAHCEADDLLLLYINDPDIMKAWKSIDKYFA